ncbi:Putative acyl-CoA thioesterase, double hotdog domain-containing protein [Septoria linicola]|uniref:Acyl-CoA thioesterase, double hotdog domain-containing protein n=1 Tax=Septoria linicola TaxID=215465 RepID=A0A9Q9AZA9_9PEZI|nr:Putative acyl-CoA thioesterase, double hotdog domain-containing protein [Septoria linicola]
MAFERATTVKQIDSHTYSADFQDDWCIGTVPHGGYKAVKKHFETTLRKQDQPHTLALHLDFLRRTSTGPAKFVIHDVKLGRQTSVVHVSLSQDGREEVVGYCTNSNLEKEVGVSFDTHWQARPQRLPLSTNLIDLEAGRDPAWTELTEWPNSQFRKATQKIRSFFPRNGQVAQNVYDEWLCLKGPDENWTNDKLGYLVDMFPQICESYILDGFDQYDPKLLDSPAGVKLRDSKKKDIPFWYPTVLLNLDVKKALPEGGVKFLFTRLQAKQIKNGRYDLEIVVLDELEEIVALSHHVCYIVSAERNAKARTPGTSKI